MRSACMSLVVYWNRIFGYHTFVTFLCIYTMNVSFDYQNNLRRHNLMVSLVFPHPLIKEFHKSDIVKINSI